MRATIIGGNYVGKGAEAMMHVVVSELRARLPDLQFTVMLNETSRNRLPERAAQFERENKVELRTMGARGLADWLAAPITKALGLSWRYYRHYFECIKGSAALLDIRGFVFVPDLSIRGANGLGYYLMSELARRNGVKHLVLPQVMGPIEGRLRRWLALHSLKHASLIVVRDPETKRILDGIGVGDYRDVAVCPDIAFLFRGAGEERAKELVRSLGLNSGEFVAITPNIRIYERAEPNSGSNVYLDSLVEAVDFVREHLGRQVLLIPHECNSARRDDVWVIERMLERLHDQRGVAVLGSEASAAEVKAVLGQAYALLGSRYHSLVAALSLGVPSVALSWSHKYEQLMELVGTREYCISRTDISGERICDRLHALAGHHRDLGRTITTSTAGIQRQIGGLFDDIAAAIGERRLGGTVAGAGALWCG